MAAYEAALTINEPINVICKQARDVQVREIQTADAYIFATPENFGYMSGELKALFDRTYEESREQTAGKCYALLIACGNDGSGAKQSVERILAGYQMKQSGLCVVAKEPVNQQSLTEAAELGEYMSVALANGVIQAGLQQKTLCRDIKPNKI